MRGALSNYPRIFQEPGKTSALLQPPDFPGDINEYSPTQKKPSPNPKNVYHLTNNLLYSAFDRQNRRWMAMTDFVFPQRFKIEIF
jgi:hypothetical protein